MTLANMRQNGVRLVWAKCEACGHQADVNVDALAETLVIPKVGQRLRCSRCGSKQINTRPAWHAASDAWGRRGQQDTGNGALGR
jgi:rRNA maturation protein Nop10